VEIVWGLKFLEIHFFDYLEYLNIIIEPQVHTGNVWHREIHGINDLNGLCNANCALSSFDVHIDEISDVLPTFNPDNKTSVEDWFFVDSGKDPLLECSFQRPSPSEALTLFENAIINSEIETGDGFAWEAKKYLIGKANRFSEMYVDNLEILDFVENENNNSTTEYLNMANEIIDVQNKDEYNLVNWNLRDGKTTHKESLKAILSQIQVSGFTPDLENLITQEIIFLIDLQNDHSNNLEQYKNEII